MKFVPILEYEKDNGERISLIQREECHYKVYEIVPNRFIETGKTVEEILMTMSSLKDPNIRIKDRILNIIPTTPFYYEIYYEGRKIHFNYVVPDKYEKILINKIDKVYRIATIKEVKDYFNMFKDKYYCKFEYKKHFLFSLNADYRENGLLEGLLSVLNNIEEKDRLLLQIGIIPLNDTWKEQWRYAYRQYRDGKNMDAHPNFFILLFDKIFEEGNKLMDIFQTAVGNKNTKGRGNTDFFDLRRVEWYRARNMTMNKINYKGFLVQIKLFCNNDTNLYYYAKMLDGVFRVLDSDQELVMGKIKKNKYPNRRFDNQVSKNIFSLKELSVFMQLPNRRMQIDFKEYMDTVDKIEVEIPKELRQGGIPIGTATYKGEKINVYWNTKNKHMAAMHKIITGLQRTGKSSYIVNFAIEAIKQGHSVFVIDTIKTCEVASNIRDYLPPEYRHKIIVLDFSNLDYLIPLAWNEIKVTKEMNKRERLKVASMIAGSFEQFLETVGEFTSDNDKLTPRMRKYLSSACKLVMSMEGTTIKDVIDVLQSYEVRKKMIEKSGLSENSLIVQELKKLDNGKGGTKYNEISGIIDRISILFNDYVMELLLSAPPNPKIDFRYWADNGYCVLIKLSDLEFSRVSLKALVTFLFSKIWLTMLSRGMSDNPNLTHVILDEIHNFPQVTNMLRSICREAAKYGLSFVFTSHLLKDLKGLLPYIKGSGANFMLFKTTKENFLLLKEELELGGFEINECLKIKDFHTINIVNYDRDYVVFQSKVIDPVNKRYKKYDRSNIDIECSKKYGVKYEE